MAITTSISRMISYLLIMLLAILTGCRKFVTVDPPETQIVSATVFASDAAATSAISGIYSMMLTDQGFMSGTNGGISMLAGLSADELINFSSSNDMEEFYTNGLLPTTSLVSSAFWGPAYEYIYDANAVLEGLTGSTGITPATKQQLAGEAKFIRALNYFYLVNLFGDTPLVLTTDYKVNAVATRTTAPKLYTQIITDLLDAVSLLTNDYSLFGGERVRPTKSVALALLARVYLYTGDWPHAETMATQVINNSNDYALNTDLSQVFLANNSEAIWQLKPVVDGQNTNEALTFIFTDVPQNAAISSGLLNAFEVGDLRRANWLDSAVSGSGVYYYPYKYKVTDIGMPLTEYTTVFRLAEQFLIRAEARAQQDNISGAQQDINMIRNRAGLGNTVANDKASILLAIEQERRIELFTEWGARWLDLKRTGRADVVLGPVKTNWKSFDTLYPIPAKEISSNPNLTQNAGY